MIAPRFVPSDSASVSPLPVLVVDDDDVVRAFAARVLREAGYAVHEAEDGAVALEILRSRRVDLRVVVSDIVMPRLNGIELLEHLARDGDNVPVLLMSGYGAADLEKRGLAAPCGIIAKPFPPERLVAEVERCIETNG